MKTSICTLFEGHYHFGVAALTNSLYRNGYRGAIYAGYRGALPKWASKAIKNRDLGWVNSSTLLVGEGLQIHFLPIHTDYHLTNYKPDFMLRLWDGPAGSVTGMYYFDPDIIVNVKWNLFEKWIACGVALCEDINSPLARNHPRRVEWRNYFGKYGIKLQYKDSMYANGGFVGLTKSNIDFLIIWKNMQEKMAPYIGGLNRSIFEGDILGKDEQSLFSPFGRTDQDALNATIEAWEMDVSFVGLEGMAFKGGNCLMSHALGQPKPWKSNPILNAFDGRSPRKVDRDFWKYSFGPLKAHRLWKVKLNIFLILLSSFFGRFYSRN